MVLRTLYLNKELDRALSEKAAASGLTKAVLIRKLLTESMEEQLAAPTFDGDHLLQQAQQIGEKDA
jgi:hypothetical protein